MAAKINQELTPLRAEISTGDHIEIITASVAKPNPAWLILLLLLKHVLK